MYRLGGSSFKLLCGKSIVPYTYAKAVSDTENTTFKRPKPLVTFKHASGIFLHATPETPIHHPCTSQILSLYPPISEKSSNKRNPIPCKITFESQFYTVGIPRDLQSCTTSTNKNWSQTRIYTCKRAFGLLHCSHMQYLKRREVHLHLPHGNLAEVWKRAFNLLTSNSWLDFHAQWKWIQKTSESGPDAFILLEVNLGAWSCLHNGEKPF